jgi:hypothetical protein
MHANRIIETHTYLRCVNQNTEWWEEIHIIELYMWLVSASRFKLGKQGCVTGLNFATHNRHKSSKYV